MAKLSQRKRLEDKMQTSTQQFNPEDMYHMFDVKKLNNDIWYLKNVLSYPKELRDKWATELAGVRQYQKEESAEWQELRDKGVVKLPDGKIIPAEEVGR
jgi:hypothetical protein